tara:strand:+ start:30814 stop:31218 length:405 start_codon:yes stop_codon:yes gene_type:complete
MKVNGLDGKKYAFPPSGYMPDNDDQRQRSSLHLRTRKILRRLYPTNRVLEEVPLPGTGGLFADFYLPEQKIVVECNGEQHYKFNAHFHGNRLNFMRAQANDRKKREWCEINNIDFIELPYNEDDNEWEHRIKSG